MNVAGLGREARRCGLSGGTGLPAHRDEPTSRNSCDSCDRRDYRPTTLPVAADRQQAAWDGGGDLDVRLDAVQGREERR